MARRNKQTGLLALCFHGVSPYEHLNKISHGLQLFEKQFEAFCFQLNQKLTNCTSEYFYSGDAPSKPYFIITFDDIYQNVIDCALPILEKYQLSFLLFPSTHYIGKDLFWWDKFRLSILASPLGNFNFFYSNFFLRDLKDKNNAINQLEPVLAMMDLKKRNEYVEELFENNYRYIKRTFSKVLPQFKPVTSESLKLVSKNPLCLIGSHGVHHLVMDKLSLSEIENEMEASKTWLQKEIGIEVTHYCFPNGSATPTSIQLANKLGYSFGHVIDEGKSCWNTLDCRSSSEFILINRIPISFSNLPIFFNQL